MHWRHRQVILLTLPRPICLHFSKRHYLSFCRSCPYCLAVASPLFMPPRPLPAPLVAPLPLVPTLSRLLSGWLLHRSSSRRRVPSAGSIVWRAGPGRRRGRCLLLSPRRCLLFCRSCASYLAGCCVTSPHAVAFPASASASCHTVASRSSALVPLVRLVVALPSTSSANPSSTNTPRARCS